jgi:predicted AlkP superfamily pyrophosphatase or phosphodiesterase
MVGRPSRMGTILAMGGAKPRAVVFIVIDGMRTDAFEQATASGRAPALAFLRRHGRYVRDSVATFPSITPAATASLVTGETPARHGIPGMCWYDRDEQRFVNYGQSHHVAMKEGVSEIAENFLVHMNHRHLSKDVRTLHESLHEMGFESASVNFLIFRGPYEHEVDPHIYERVVFRNGLPDRISGPKEHYFADMVKGPADAGSKRKRGRGLERRTRLNDKWAADVTRDLLEQEAADMIVFYLHENDHVSHVKGPHTQTENLIQASEHIGYVLDTFGSWEETLDRVGFVITADHGQSAIFDDDEHIIDFDDVLADFTRVVTGKGEDRFGGNDLAVCGNGRAAFVYAAPGRREELVEPVVKAVLQSPGVDQALWREGDSYLVDSDRGRLRFRPARSGGVVDERGNRWEFDGELQAVDGVDERGEVRTPEYPLALWRIKNALDLDRIGDVVVTMRLGYDCDDLMDENHKGGGDHASLHALDSTIPFLSTLADPPLHPAAVDVTPHILRHFERLKRAG